MAGGVDAADEVVKTGVGEGWELAGLRRGIDDKDTADASRGSGARGEGRVVEEEVGFFIKRGLKAHLRGEAGEPSEVDGGEVVVVGLVVEPALGAPPGIEAGEILK